MSIPFAEALKTGQFNVGKVCQDCTMVLVNGDGSGNDSEWDEAKYDATCATYSLTPGHPHDAEWHDCHEGRCEDDCDCERTEFSTSECDVCGSRLHGERHDFLMIERELLA